MLTHAEVNRRFVQLDTHPVLLTTSFDGWLAWPIVKERLWLACLNASQSETEKSISPGAGLRRLISGARQLATSLLAPRSAGRALLYEQRLVPLPKGGSVHPHLGAFPDSRADFLHVIYGEASARGSSNVLLDHGIGAVAAALAWMVRAAPGIRRTARQIIAAVSPACPEISERSLYATVTDQLARFRVRHALFRLLFRRWRIRSVIVLDPDGKVPEVAAAKSLLLPVLEVQHGMFSAREPDYSWSGSHRSGSTKLPLPDKIVVFGPLWRHELIRAGYWRSEEIVQSRSPVMTAFRTARAKRQSRHSSEPLTVLFPSQGYVRNTALSFWHEVLSATSDLSLRLRIKIHPLEQMNRSDYSRLAKEFPHACQLVPETIDGFEELLRADLVAGYTSLMLLEAIGLGIPVVGLRGGAVVEGFSSVFNLPSAVTLVEEIDTPAQFLDRITLLRQPGVLESESRRIDAISATIFDLNGPSIETVLETA